jgi:beta-phosphoglucomutase-like phosphatase (HAD superfamily)
MERIDLVIFDMDGLIFDTERLAVAAWVAAGQRFGVPVTPEAIVEVIGLDAQATEAVLRGRYGADMPYAEMRQFRVAHASAQIEAEGLPIKPGLYELLELLEARGIRRALATSGPPSTWPWPACWGVSMPWSAAIRWCAASRSRTSFWPPRRQSAPRQRPA